MSFVSALVSILGVLILSSCSVCKQARTQIVDPTRKVLGYLAQSRTGQDLETTGCPMILRAFENLPYGIDLIRHEADNQFTRVEKKCLRYGTLDKLRLKRGFHAGDRHAWETIQVPGCLDFEVVTSRLEPGYSQALALAIKLEGMYARTLVLCKAALAQNYKEAELASDALLIYILKEVKPEGEELFSRACGGESATPSP